MIRVLVVDDHPAVRTGLLVAMRTEPGIVAVAGVGTAADAVTEARRSDIDVALVDYHLPDENGLSLCRALKQIEPPPRVLLYTAFAGSALKVPAKMAGADGLVDKGVPTDSLLDAIRDVMRDSSRVPSSD